MTEDFCKRTARRIRKFGYAPEAAVRISKFCHVSMVSVCGMMGVMLDPSMKSLAGEEDERLLLRAVCFLSQGMHGVATGSGDFLSGAPAGMISPAFSGLRR
jgi:hypothetical protein